MRFLEEAGAPDGLAEKALFLAGAVQFYREAYREAGGSFTRLVQRFPEGTLTPQALELGLLSKVLILGEGPDGDQVAAEARELIRKARREYPKLARDKDDFLDAKALQLDSFQSDRAMKRADEALISGRREYARKLYADLVRTYPSTQAAVQAGERLKKVFGGRALPD
jgi:TolA-binding protein